MSDKPDKPWRMVFRGGGDWGFPNCASIYLEGQNENFDDAFIAIRGGSMQCIRSAHEAAANEKRNQDAQHEALTIVNSLNNLWSRLQPGVRKAIGKAIIDIGQQK